MKNSLKTAMVFIGTVIGAGFASGQEIVRFFLAYGEKSFWGIVLTGVLFTLIAYTVLCKICKTGANSLDSYFEGVVPRGVRAFFFYIITMFMLASFIVMLAGSGAMLQQQAGLPQWVGIAAMAAMCLVVFLCGVEGIVKLNQFLTPLMIVGILVVCGGRLLSDTIQPVFAAGDVHRSFLFSAVIYVSYNVLTIVVIMTSIGGLLSSRRQCAVSAGVGGGMLFVLAALVWYMLKVHPDSYFYEIPMLGALEGMVKWCYVPVLYVAMLTTAVSSGFGAINNICARFGVRPQTASLVLCLAGAPVSFLGFSNLVGKLYYFFGVVGLIAMAVILIDGLKYVKNKE